MLTVRPQDLLLIKERSSCPSAISPLMIQPFYLSGPLSRSLPLVIIPTSQGPCSPFGRVFSHDPHQLPMYPMCRYCSSFVLLVR